MTFTNSIFYSCFYSGLSFSIMNRIKIAYFQPIFFLRFQKIVLKYAILLILSRKIGIK